MKSLVIAVTALALAGTAIAQTELPKAPVPSTEQQVQDAAKAADQAADTAAAAAETAVSEAGAAAEKAADEAADAAARAGDAAAQAAKGASEAVAIEATDAAKQAAEEAAAAADKAAASASKAADAAADEAAKGATEAEDAVKGAADQATGEMAEGEPVAPPVIAPDVNAPAISEADPGVLGSWVTSRNIWTTNQPSTTVWVDPALDQRPAEWQNIAKINDIVLGDSGEQVVGYIADIGGFLGIGAKKVLLGPDAIHLLTIGDETFFATNYTKEELEALPDFDEKTVRK